MLLTAFDPPGNVDDLPPGSPAYNDWSAWVSDTIDREIARLDALLGSGHSQLYNPSRTETTSPTAELTITWEGFPMKFLRQFRDSRMDAWRAADVFVSSVARNQDEYLEWFAYKNGDGKILRIDFTCEPYDYWTFLGVHAPAKLLELYQTHIDPSIRHVDLFPGGGYDRLNPWNTEKGAMHLTHNANSLGAEINLVAGATVLWQKDGNPVTDPLQFIRCGGFGGEVRSSDPRIGWDIGNLARMGFAITLKNPVGLLIDGIDDTGFLKPDGTPAGNYWRVLRGFSGGAVRATYQVPASEGFAVGDLTIGGNKVEFGGQVAEHVTMKVVGLACRPGSFSNVPRACGVPGPAGFGMIARPGMGSRLEGL